MELQVPYVLYAVHLCNVLQGTAKGTHDTKDADLACPFKRGQRLNKVIALILAYLHSEQM